MEARWRLLGVRQKTLLLRHRSNQSTSIFLNHLSKPHLPQWNQGAVYRIVGYITGERLAQIQIVSSLLLLPEGEIVTNLQGYLPCRIEAIRASALLTHRKVRRIHEEPPPPMMRFCNDFPLQMRRPRLGENQLNIKRPSLKPQGFAFQWEYFRIYQLIPFTTGNIAL